MRIADVKTGSWFLVSLPFGDHSMLAGKVFDSSKISNCREELLRWWSPEVSAVKEDECWDGKHMSRGGLSWAWWPSRWEAEDTCIRNVGHLASVSYGKELEEMMALEFRSANSQIWLGGTFDSGTGNWSWTDGEEWGVTRWEEGFPEDDYKKVMLGLSTESRLWRNYRFLCFFMRGRFDAVQSLQ